jgi:hypothetical protein
MTATLTQVRQAIATALGTIAGLEAHAFRPGSITPPAAIVYPAPGQFLDYQVTMDAESDLRLVILVIVEWGEEQSAAEQLDAFIADSGASSINGTIDANQTLGGIVDGCDVIAAQDYGTYTIGGVEYLGVEFPLQVLL